MCISSRATGACAATIGTMANMTSRRSRPCRAFRCHRSSVGGSTLAFYGVGAEAEHIFFFCRQDYAEFDVRRGAVIRSGAIEQRFPALAAFAGAAAGCSWSRIMRSTPMSARLPLGGWSARLQVPPQSRRTSVVVTRVTVPATVALQRNLIERQSQASIADFYARVAALPPPETRIGEEASAALWGGEGMLLAAGMSWTGGATR